MKREEMSRIVQSELKHIPRGVRGSPQNWLRYYYNGMRREDLAVNPTTSPKETLERALELSKKNHPSYFFQYDSKFFR